MQILNTAKPKRPCTEMFPYGSLPKGNTRLIARDHTYTHTEREIKTLPKTINRVQKKAKTTDAMQLGIRIQNQNAKKGVCAYADYMQGS